MESLLYQIDVNLFRLINGTAGGMLDPLMLLLSSRALWIICGIVAFMMALFRRNRRLVLGLLFVTLTLGFADFFTYTFLKPGFSRDRPCYHLENVNLVQTSCGSQFGFPSNHAANGMAAAVAAGLYFGFKRTWFLLLVAVVVGYTRIYLGVHFPFDILFGFLAGSIYALFLWFLVWRPLAAPMERVIRRVGLQAR